MTNQKKNRNQFSVTLPEEVQRDIEGIRLTEHDLSLSAILCMLVKSGLYMYKIRTTDNENLKTFLINMLWLDASETDEVEKILTEKAEQE